MAVFPNKVVSQTTYNEDLQGEKFAFIQQGDPAVAEELYNKWLLDKKVKAAQKSYCSCVNYAKSLTGYNQSVGNARNWPINTKTPSLGGVVVTNESLAGHVAVIVAIEGNLLTVKEANYSRCMLTTRIINNDDPAILGFWEKR